jgi:hypothetical protein
MALGFTPMSMVVNTKENFKMTRLMGKVSSRFPTVKSTRENSKIASEVVRVLSLL